MGDGDENNGHSVCHCEVSILCPSRQQRRQHASAPHEEPREVVGGLPRFALSHRLRSQSRRSPVALNTGVQAVRSASPAPGLADKQPVYPGTSVPDGRL